MGRRVVFCWARNLAAALMFIRARCFKARSVLFSQAWASILIQGWTLCFIKARASCVLARCCNVVTHIPHSGGWVRLVLEHYCVLLA